MLLLLTVSFHFSSSRCFISKHIAFNANFLSIKSSLIFFNLIFRILLSYEHSSRHIFNPFTGSPSSSPMLNKFDSSVRSPRLWSLTASTPFPRTPSMPASSVATDLLPLLPICVPHRVLFYFQIFFCRSPVHFYGPWLQVLQFILSSNETCATSSVINKWHLDLFLNILFVATSFCPDQMQLSVIYDRIVGSLKNFSHFSNF